MAGALLVAFGTLLAAAPDLSVRWLGVPQLRALQGMFLLYAAIGITAVMIYRGLAENQSEVGKTRQSALGPSRSTVYQLAMLLGIDASCWFVVCCRKWMCRRAALCNGRGDPAGAPRRGGITTVPRSLAAALSPAIGGYLLTISSFGWPLLIGGVVKTAYDLALLLMFQQVRPSEERHGAQASHSTT